MNLNSFLKQAVNKQYLKYCTYLKCCTQARFFFAVFLLLALVFFSTNVHAATNVSACGTLSSANTYYVLNTSLNSPALDCIKITADNITLDCYQYGNYYSITNVGEDKFSTNGVYVNSSDSVTIKNCRIVNFYTGVYSQDSNYLNVSFNTLYDNAYGISVYNSNFSNVSSNNVSYDWGGINSYASDNGTIENNKIIATTERGIQLRAGPSGGDYGSHYVLVKNNTIEAWNDKGIFVGDGGVFAPLKGNQPLQWGTSNYNTIFNNTITVNGSEYGISVDSGDYNNVSYNVITASNFAGGIGENGLSIVSFNTITVTGNGNCIAAGGVVGGSTYYNNNAESENGACLLAGGDNNYFYSNSFTSAISDGVQLAWANWNTFNTNVFNGGSYGVYVLGSSYNNFSSSTISGGTKDIGLDGGSYDNVFVNCTFDKSDVEVDPNGDTGSRIIVKWFVRPRVVSSFTGQGIPGATVTIKDANGVQVFSGATNSQGYTARQNVTEYIQNFTDGVVNYTPHNFTVSKNPWNSTMFYITDSDGPVITLDWIPGSGAVSGANATNLTNTTWYGATPSGVSLAGGNVTNATLWIQSQTWKWAGFYGDIYANLSLKDAAGNSFYYWSVLNVSGAVVAIQNSSPDWSSIDANPLTGADIDAAFFPSDSNAADNATQTFNDTSWGGTIAGTTINSGVANAGVKPFGSGGWNEEAINVSVDTAVNQSIAFVGNINHGGGLWNGGLGDYEILVPARNPDGTKTFTYYFFVSLGS